MFRIFQNLFELHLKLKEYPFQHRFPLFHQNTFWKEHLLHLHLELSESGAGYVDKLREMGFLINCTAGNVLRFVPPLIITNEEIDKFVEALDKAL